MLRDPETFKREVQSSGHPLAAHSLNQKRLGIYMDRLRTGDISKKEGRSQRRKERLVQEIQTYVEGKESRIRGRVEAVLAGYDGSCPEVFSAELAYLRRLGVVYERFERVN